MAYPSDGTPHGSRGVQNPLELAPLIVFIQLDGAAAKSTLRTERGIFLSQNFRLLLPRSKGLGLSD
jgi:hypothetical protein